MARLRILVFVLILLNLLASAALLGWLGSPTPRGEPERLTNQLNPERIRLRPAARPGSSAAAPVKPSAPPVLAEVAPLKPPPPAAQEACVAFAPLSPEAAHGLAESLATRPEIKFRDLPVEVPSSWWVIVPPADSKEAAEARVAELRQKGVTDFFIVQEPGPNQFAVSLGLFKQEAPAVRLLEQLQSKGVSMARVIPRGVATHRLELRGPEEGLAALAGEIARRFPAAGRQDCPP